MVFARTLEPTATAANIRRMRWLSMRLCQRNQGQWCPRPRKYVFCCLWQFALLFSARNTDTVYAMQNIHKNKAISLQIARLFAYQWRNSLYCILSRVSITHAHTVTQTDTHVRRHMHKKTRWQTISVALALWLPLYFFCYFRFLSVTWTFSHFLYFGQVTFMFILFEYTLIMAIYSPSAPRQLCARNGLLLVHIHAYT